LCAAKAGVIEAQHPDLGAYFLYAENDPPLLFCENETNASRLFGDNEAKAHPKDSFHDYVVGNNQSAVNPGQIGATSAANYLLTAPARGAARVRLRLARGAVADPFRPFDDVIRRRLSEADAFYADLQKDITDQDARYVQRQAFAGMIWSKQFYYYDV